VSDLIRTPYGDLGPEVFPEKKFKKRYIGGIEGIMNHEFIRNPMQKQVIILVSHHKGIKHMFKWAGKKIKISDPDYCTTLGFRIVSALNERGYDIKSTEILS